MSYEEDLAEAMAEYRMAHLDKTAAEARKESANTKIKLLLKTNNINRFQSSTHVTNLSIVKKRVQDKNALDAFIKQASADTKCLEDFKEEQEYERLTVKDLEE